MNPVIVAKFVPSHIRPFVLSDIDPLEREIVGDHVGVQFVNPVDSLVDKSM